MGQVTGIFMRQARLDSLMLRTGMWSSWSHVALIMPDENSVIDATFFHDVARRPLGDLTRVASKMAFRVIEVLDPSACYDFARSQIGKPYDTWGVAGIGLHRNWQSEDSWFCSEFFEACLAAGGNKRFINQIHRVTTQHSWMVK
jgi:hypothetical protein